MKQTGRSVVRASSSYVGWCPSSRVSIGSLSLCSSRNAVVHSPALRSGVYGHQRRLLTTASSSADEPAGKRKRTTPSKKETKETTTTTTRRKKKASSNEATSTAPAVEKKEGVDDRGAVFTSNAPFPIGPYSQAIVANGPLLFVSGCIGLTHDNNFAGSDVGTQTEQVMRNMEAILKAGGSSLEDVVKCTILLTDMRDFAAVNQVYAKYFPTRPPARSTFATNGLPKGALVEIECIASVKSGQAGAKSTSKRAGRTKAKTPSTPNN